MYRTNDIAIALTEAWVRNGATNKEPREIVDFYCALCDALEQAQGKDISKAKEARGEIDSRYMVVQVASVGILTLLAAIGILFAMYVK
jgi:hypothetical protein